MQQRKTVVVDAYPDQPEQIETLHLYIVPDDEYQDDNSPQFDLHKWANRFMACLACLMLACFVFVPGSKLYQTKSITIPLIAMPVQTYVTSAEIKATGVKNYPATNASGELTIYNGSILSQTLPQGFLVTASDGTEFALDNAVTIDGAMLPSVGTATVSVHALQPGSQGNIGALAINQSYGSSLVVKNLSAFTGGQDSYTEHFVTDQDKAKALDTARATLTNEKPLKIQQKPCTETVQESTKSLTLTWQCQFYSYHVPANLDVVSIQVQANDVLIQYREVIHE